MERLVEVEGKDIRLKAHGNVPNLYEAEFGEDIYAEMQDMEETGKVRMSVFNRFMWICAKIADPDILPYEQWNESFTSPPHIQCFEELEPLLKTLMPVGKRQAKRKAPAKRS